MTNHPNPNSAAQHVLTNDEILAAVRPLYANAVAAQMGAGDDLSTARAIESALLPKLRAPVSDIREGFELTYAANADDPACASDLSHFTNGWRACIMSQVGKPVVMKLEVDTTATIARINDEVARLRAPVADERAAAINPEECNAEVYKHGTSVGLFAIPKEDANAICAGIAAATGARVDWHYIAGRVHIKALPALASAPVAGHQPYPAMPEPDVNHPGEQEDGYSRAAVETAMRAAHDRGYSVGWDHGKEHASSPVAGEAQPLGYVCASGLGLLARGDYATILAKSRPGYQFPVYAAPQASAEDVRNAALEQAAHLMEQTGKRIAASDIRALKQPQADKDGGQQRAAFDHPVFAFLLGEGPLHDVHFGDRHPSERGAYWWRKDLRAALSATQTEQGERDAG